MNENQDFKCPTCDGFIPHNDAPGLYPGALSRRDNKTEICSACGTREALEDLATREGICGDCGTSEKIVHSGVDALLLGVMDRIQKICYDCANAEALQKAAQNV